MQLDKLACSYISFDAVLWAFIKFHELTSSSMSLHAVSWACMQFHELVCSSFLCLSSSQEFSSACLGNNRYKQPHHYLFSHYPFFLLFCLSDENNYWAIFLLDSFYLAGMHQTHNKSCLFTFEYLSHYPAIHYFQLRMDFKVFR